MSLDNRPALPILLTQGNPQEAVTDLLTGPIRAGRHLAIWILWHSTGVSLLPPGGDG